MTLDLRRNSSSYSLPLKNKIKKLRNFSHGRTHGQMFEIIGVVAVFDAVSRTYRLHYYYISTLDILEEKF